MKIRLMMLVFTLLVVLAACQQDDNESDTIKVAVSILPQKAFVEGVAGDLVDVTVLIPPGASPANYQPSPKEMTDLSQSDIYFSIGVPTEAANIMPVVEQEGLPIVDLAHQVADVYPDRYFGAENDHDHDEGHEENHEEDHEEDHENHDHDHGGRDPHIWMSPQRVVVMVEVIRDELSQLDPDNQEIYKENAQAYIDKLNQLDQDLKQTFEALAHKSFIIMHPSLGYFSEDYGLTMVALEKDGKEATAAHLEKVIDYAKEHEIQVVFYQAEFDYQQAEVIAEEIQGEVMEFAPLSPDYLAHMEEIKATFKKVLTK